MDAHIETIYAVICMTGDYFIPKAVDTPVEAGRFAETEEPDTPAEAGRFAGLEEPDTPAEAGRFVA